MPGIKQSRPAPDELVAAALAQSADRSGSGCLEPEELAAYYEHSLEAAELDRSEAHVASCLGCQQRLVALVRSEPEPAAMAPWWPVWMESPRRWAWAAPALAVGLAAAVWFAAGPERAPAPEFTVASKAPQQKPAPSPGETEPVTVEAPSVTLPAEAEQPGARARAELARPSAGRDAAALPPPAAATPESVTAAAEPPATGAPALEKRRADVLAERAAALALSAHLIQAPGGRIVWRVDMGGAIARSDDGGESWRIQTTVGVELLAGAAPSGTVCWVVGRAGTVLRTADGERWRRVAAPATGDLVKIAATDALHASVTAADGRRYETADGGATWREIGR